LRHAEKGKKTEKLPEKGQKGISSSYSPRGARQEHQVKTVILYLIALTGIMIASWQIQEIHLGWGYTLGIAGLLVAFFVAVNALTKDSRK
jgi:hypothetical protein